MADADARLAPARAVRHDGWTLERQRAFIETLAQTGSVAAAARRVGLSTTAAYSFRRRNEGKPFDCAWTVALAHALQALEQCAMDRAINGTENPVFYRGEVVGHRVTTHERLMMFILERHGGRVHTGLRLQYGEGAALGECVAASDYDDELTRALERLPADPATPPTSPTSQEYCAAVDRPGAATAP